MRELDENTRRELGRAAGIVSRQFGIGLERTALWALAYNGSIIDEGHANDVTFELEVVVNHLKERKWTPRDEYDNRPCFWRLIARMSSYMLDAAA